MERTGISYSHFPSSCKLIYKSIPTLFDERSRKSPESDLFVFLKYSGLNIPFLRSSVTWRDLCDNSLKVASGLLKLGLKSGDRVAIFGRSIPNWLYMQYGVLRIKVLLIPVPASLMYSEKLPDFLEHHRVELLVLDPGQDDEIVTKMTSIFPNLADIIHNKCEIKVHHPSRVLFLDNCGSKHDSTSLDDFITCDLTKHDIESVNKIQSTIDPDDPAIIYASSGSTGIPKLVVHSHFTLNSSYALYCNILKIGSAFFNDRPFTWLGAVIFLPLTCDTVRIHLDAPGITMEDYAKLMFRIIEQEQVTCAMLMTSTLQDMRHMMRSGQNKLSDSLEVIVAGGEKIPEDMVEDLNESVEIFGDYGASEVPVMGFYRSSEPKYKMEDGNDMFLYRPSGPVEIKIVDDDGMCVPYGIGGKLLCRQPAIFLGYLDDQDATDRTITKAGWCHTGDMAVMYPSGSFHVLGRTSDVITKAGVKLYPSRLEAMLLRCQKLTKVAVCSIPDEKFNEEICACVVPASGCDVTVDELRTHCQQFQPAGIHVPLYPQHFILLDQLPNLSNGKVDKKRIRTLFLELVMKI